MSSGVKNFRYVTWLLSLWLIFIFLCLSQNHIANTQELFDEEDIDFDIPSYVDLYPEDPNDRTACVYKNEPYEHAEKWIQDECSRCFCNNGTTNCVYESCNPPCDAYEQIKVEGECCRKCPPKVTVSRVDNLLAPDIEIVEGSEQKITFDIEVRIEKPRTSRNIHGVFLWKLSTWISKSFDGLGRRLSYADNILTPEQQDNSFSKPSYPPWPFNNLSLTLDTSSEGLCGDFKYVCVEFNKGDNAISHFNLPFTFGPSNGDERRLIGCAPLGLCKGVIIRDFDWTIDAERTIPGELDDVTVSLTVFPRSDSRDMEGTGLWQATLFGSSDFEGLGSRYGEVSQILNKKEASKAVKKAKPMKFRDLDTRFDLGIIGCIAEASYVCLEFRQGELPQPDFTLQFAEEEEEISEAESLIKCMPRKCGAKAVFSSLIPVIKSPPSLIESTPGQRVSLNVTAISDKLLSTSVEGRNLWNMDVFFSDNSNGSGSRIEEQIEILTPAHQMVPLIKDADIVLDDVLFEVDLSDLVCSDIPFMCVELRKNPSATIDYEFGTNPEQDPFVGCLDMADICRGIIAKNLDWRGDIPDFVNGDVKPVQSIMSNATIDVESVSRDITGDNLWQMSVFASSSRKALPDDILLPYFDQILTDEQSRLPVPKDGVLRFYNMQTPPFQVDRMGCGKFKFLCYKFQKARRSGSNFAFHTDTGEKFVLNCQKMVCKAVTPLRLNWTIDAAEHALGRKTPVKLDVTTVLGEDTRDIEGNQLWRLGMFGSNSPNGTGPKFDEVYQLLDDSAAALPIQNRQPIVFGELPAMFEIGTVGCIEDVNYICLEFQKNQNPDPDYVILIQDDEGNDAQSLISCKKQACLAKAVFEDLTHVFPNSVIIMEGKSNPPITVSLDAIADKLESTEVAGEDLWEVSTFFSNQSKGLGPRILEQNQILNRLDDSKTLQVGRDLIFPSVEFSTDLSNHECSDIPYICFQLRRNSETNVNYEFLPDPEAEPLIDCSSTADMCKGVIARFLTWTQYEDEIEPLAGELVPLRGDVTIDVVPSSRDLEGKSLWKLTAYASNAPNGDRPLSPIFQQALSPAQSGTPLVDGGPLVFENIETPPYPVAKLGCGPSKYLCFELRKSEESDIDYAFETTTGEDVLRECMLQECETVFGTSMNWTITSSEDPIPGEKSPVLLDIDVAFEDYSKNVSGDYLWQVSLFGSQSPEGDGERFGEEEQVLWYLQSSQMIQNDHKLMFREADAFFDIASIGCKNYTHICVEFQKAPYSSANFSMIVLSEFGPHKTILSSCQVRECDAKVTFEDLEVSLTSEVLIEGAPDQLVEVDIEAIADLLKSTNVGGENLWKLKSFFSTNKDGSDKVGDIYDQIISEEQANQPFLNGEDFSFDNLRFNVDLVNHSCLNIPFICFELEKDSSSSINYAFKTNPPEEPVRKCISTSPVCEGIIVDDFDWTMEDPLAVPLVPSSITTNVSVSLLPVGRNLTGEDLWKVSFFSSKDETGIPRGNPFFEQVLSPEWARQSLSPGDDELLFEEVELPPVEFFSLSCGGQPYLCLEFSRHENSTKEFTLETTAGEESIVKCHHQECNLVVYPEDLSWDLEADLPVPGRATPISLNVSLPFKNTSTPFEGEGLWRFGIFGSNSPTGKQKRFKEVRQILSPNETNIPSRQNIPFVANTIMTNFDVGSIGCHKDISYICVEFAKGDSPTPGYNFATEDDENSVISCKEQECIARVEFDDLIPTLHLPDKIIENTDGQIFNVSLLGLTDKERSTLVAGVNLWQINTFFTKLENGTGERIDEKVQILDDGQESKELLRGDDLPLDFLDFDVNLAGQTCDEIPYMCFELKRNPKANINYQFEESVMKCIDVSELCKGVVFKSLDFQVDIPQDLKLGEKKPLNVDAVVNIEPYSREVAGDDLWKVAVFPSADTNGLKRIGTYSEQLLLDYQAATHLPPGGPLVLNDVLTDRFDVRSLACSDYNYLCMEFSKGNTPSTKYTFRTQSDDPSLISCKQLDCNGKLFLFPVRLTNIRLQ